MASNETQYAIESLFERISNYAKTRIPAELFKEELARIIEISRDEERAEIATALKNYARLTGKRQRRG